MVEPEIRESAGPRRARPEYLREYVIALLAALVLYVISVAPGALWQDSGWAQVRTVTRDLRGDLGLALSHPLYYLMTIAFQALPFDESAYKTNLVSAVFGAVTVANVFLLVRRRARYAPAAWIAAASLAVAHTFWYYCAVAKIYTLSTALLSAELLCLGEYLRSRRTLWLVLLFAANGLGISNHMLASLSLACYGILLLWLLARGRVRWTALPFCGVAWIAGAAIYLGMIATEIAGGATVGDTIRSAFFGTEFAAQVLNTLPTARGLLRSAAYLGLDFPTPVVLLALVGLVAAGRGRYGVFGGALIGLLAIHLLWAIRYDVPDQYQMFIFALVLIAVFIGLGVDEFLRIRPRGWRVWLVVGALLPAAVYACLPAVVRAAGFGLGTRRDVPYRDTYSYFLQPWKTGYRGAAEFGQAVQELLPDGAFLIADSTTVRPIHYMMATGRWHKSVRVFPPLERPNATWRPQEAELRQELDAGRVYVVTPTAHYCPQWLIDRYELEKVGAVYRVMGSKGR